jgi:hypothetical protein
MCQIYSDRGPAPVLYHCCQTSQRSLAYQALGISSKSWKTLVTRNRVSGKRLCSLHSPTSRERVSASSPPGQPKGAETPLKQGCFARSRAEEAGNCQAVAGGTALFNRMSDAYQGGGRDGPVSMSLCGPGNQHRRRSFLFWSGGLRLHWFPVASICSLIDC